MRLTLLPPVRYRRRNRRFLVPSKVAAGTIAITAPVANQWKRGGGSSVNFTVSGTYAGTPSAVEVSTNGGSSWATLDAVPAGGNYTGTVSLAVSETDYTISVRFSNDTGVTASVSGIANLARAVAYGGQSNESGRGNSGTSTPAFTPYGSGSHKRKTAAGYANLTSDPTGTEVGTSGNSYAMQEVNGLSAVLGKRFGVCNFAVGGTTIAQWLKGAGTGYYEALAAAVTAVGGADIVHMGPCESDAVAGTSQANYHTRLASFASDWAADFPTTKIVWRTLQPIGTGSASQANQDAVNAAILAAAGSTPGEATGDVTGVYLFDVRGLTADVVDDLHWANDRTIGAVGSAAAAAAYKVLNPAAGGSGVSGARIFGGF